MRAYFLCVIATALYVLIASFLLSRRFGGVKNCPAECIALHLSFGIWYSVQCKVRLDSGSFLLDPTFESPRSRAVFSMAPSFPQHPSDLTSAWLRSQREDRSIGSSWIHPPSANGGYHSTLMRKPKWSTSSGNRLSDVEG